jgi:CBS domain-containing protein
MTASVHSVAPDVSVDDARTLMRRRRIHHLVVNNARGDWVGIVSAQELDRRPARRIRRPLKVADVMTRHDTAIHHRVVHRRRARADGVW